MGIRTVKEQYEIKDKILKERFKIIPKLMEETEIDVWLILSKEYNEDPILDKLTPSRFINARRLTILVLHNDNGILKKYCVNRPDNDLETFYQRDYDLDKETQLEALERVLRRCKADRIGINISEHFALSDGLTVGLYNLLIKKISKDITDKFISAEYLGIKYLEKRTNIELEYYKEVIDVAMCITNKAFSNEVITPNVTTCEDVENYMLQSVNDLGLECWFLPHVDLQRKDGMFSKKTVIQRGDLLHYDFGIYYLGLCTDTQRLAYVLREDETNIPSDIIEAFKLKNNRFQEIVCNNFAVNKTGNEVLVESLRQGIDEGLNPCLYTHPLGCHGHAAGPTIGLWNQQTPIEYDGDIAIVDSTGYALELNVKAYLETYQREIILFSEESIIFKDGKCNYLADKHEEIAVIK